MKPTVYVETTVIGYLKSWQRQDVTVAAHQDTTRQWWKTAADRFDLVASQLVVDECAKGDSMAAKDRLEAIDGLNLLPTTAEAEALARALVAGLAVPKNQSDDALHIALAASHGIQYLVSWNFKHIVNAAMRSAIERISRAAGYEPPVICTPEELLEE